tara:strand:+ start:130 stop:390 length:261 start_codon:yes stop_codon:yes gene_type:complete
MNDEWFFLQSMKRNGKERLLEAARQAIVDAHHKILDLQLKLDKIPKQEQKNHPIRFAWIKARSEYWHRVAEMRDIENGKSATNKEP